MDILITKSFEHKIFEKTTVEGKETERLVSVDGYSKGVTYDVTETVAIAAAKAGATQDDWAHEALKKADPKAAKKAQKDANAVKSLNAEIKTLEAKVKTLEAAAAGDTPDPKIAELETAAEATAGEVTAVLAAFNAFTGEGTDDVLTLPDMTAALSQPAQT